MFDPKNPFGTDPLGFNPFKEFGLPPGLEKEIENFLGKLTDELKTKQAELAARPIRLYQDSTNVLIQDDEGTARILNRNTKFRDFSVAPTKNHFTNTDRFTVSMITNGSGYTFSFHYKDADKARDVLDLIAEIFPPVTGY